MTLLIATPIYGTPASAQVAFGYHRAVRKLEADGAIVLGGDLASSEDLVKARMRMSHGAMQLGGWEWILWWDADVVPRDVAIVKRMIDIATERDWDVIGAPYPRKNIRATFPYRPTNEALKLGEPTGDGRYRVPLLLDDAQCQEVQALGFGFLLMRRHVLHKMADAYRDELWCVENVNGEHREMVSTFSLLWTQPQVVNGARFREQLNEDYSWCVRWRKIGGRIFMYCGELSPLAHVGGHAYTATREEIGIVR